MEKEDLVRVECEDINHRGMGIGRHKGLLLFIPGLIIGDIADVEITEMKKNYAVGTIKKIIKKSPYRIDSVCPVYDNCGGCSLLTLDYKKQLAHKVQMAESAFSRIGHLALKVDAIIGMDKPYRYRNKVQFAFKETNGKVICGFYRRGAHEVISLEDCKITPQRAVEITLYITDLVNFYRLCVYDKSTKRGLLRSLMLRVNRKEEYMIVLITKDKVIPHEKDITANLLQKFPDIKTIIQIITTDSKHEISSGKTKVLAGSGILIDNLSGLLFVVSPQSFFQINLYQTEKLYDKVLSYAQPQSTDIVVDAYCGVGTMTLLFAKHCRQLYGIESMAAAINNAKENATLNNITNVKFILGKAEEEINKLGSTIDILIVDPPRKGCDRKLLTSITKQNIKKLVYVSCDMATLARDLVYLAPHYDIEGVTLVDMFPHTMHVECVVLMCASSEAGKC